MRKSNQTRKQYSAEQKVEIVKRHLVKKETVSEVCESVGITPNMFYRWQQELFDNAHLAFETKKRGPKAQPVEKKLRHENDRLRSHIEQKNEVIAEITQEYVELKKNLGED